MKKTDKAIGLEELRRNAQRSVRLFDDSFEERMKFALTVFDEEDAVRYLFDIFCAETGWNIRGIVQHSFFNGRAEKIEQATKMLDYIRANLADRILTSLHLLIHEAFTMSFLSDRTVARNQQIELLKTQKTDAFGIKRGRQAGKKDAKPRKKRATSMDRRKILVAMREIGREPIYRKDVAPKIGVSAKTLGQQIGKEEWEELIAEAFSTGSEK